MTAPCPRRVIRTAVTVSCTTECLGLAIVSGSSFGPISCPPDDDCLVVCDGDRSCEGAWIAQMPDVTSHHLHVRCAGDYGCSGWGTVDCSDVGAPGGCSVECAGDQACKGMDFVCGAEEVCGLKCSGATACDSTTCWPISCQTLQNASWVNSSYPTSSPVPVPSLSPTVATAAPSPTPRTASPSAPPRRAPTAAPSRWPSARPSSEPTGSPAAPTSAPTFSPAAPPSPQPTRPPTPAQRAPTRAPRPHPPPSFPPTPPRSSLGPAPADRLPSRSPLSAAPEAPTAMPSEPPTTAGRRSSGELLREAGGSIVRAGEAVAHLAGPAGSRAVVILSLDCHVRNEHPGEKMDFDFHPIGLPLGDHTRYYAGAIWCNAASVVVVLSALYLIGLVRAGLAERREGAPLSSLPKRIYPLSPQRLGALRLPSAGIVPYRYLAQGTTVAAGRCAFALSYASPGAHLLGVVALVVLLTVPPLVWYRKLSARFFRAAPAADSVLYQKGPVWGPTRCRIYRAVYGPTVWASTRPNFAESYGLLFEGYSPGRLWWLIPELLHLALFAFFAAWRPSDPVSCDMRNFSAAVLFAVYAAALWHLRPYLSPVGGALQRAIAVLNAIAAALLAAGWSHDHWGQPPGRGISAASAALLTCGAVAILATATAQLVLLLFTLGAYCFDSWVGRRRQAWAAGATERLATRVEGSESSSSTEEASAARAAAERGADSLGHGPPREELVPLKSTPSLRSHSPQIPPQTAPQGKQRRGSNPLPVSPLPASRAPGQFPRRTPSGSERRGSGPRPVSPLPVNRAQSSSSVNRAPVPPSRRSRRVSGSDQAAERSASALGHSASGLGRGGEDGLGSARRRLQRRGQPPQGAERPRRTMSIPAPGSRMAYPAGRGMGSISDTAGVESGRGRGRTPRFALTLAASGGSGTASPLPVPDQGELDFALNFPTRAATSLDEQPQN
eukprot:TRINITY_DN39025_c0_g1_i1.p1 TRINITY_DN39025_c0_g1~~TRINITY_DN39025_c0_g1_i1.p1  ORF type:complete len:952 (+),score=154.22 TRINITY_DN39025_c0_g1_i1:75-2930(+)